MLSRRIRPERDEAAEYYFNYIDLVPDGDICELLEQQRTSTLGFLRGISEGEQRFAYAPGKWTVTGVLAHINDCERLFVFRAFWFARGFDSPLPSFDQAVAARNDGAEQRPWNSHVDEFASLRDGTLALFRHLPEEAWGHRGIASDNQFSVRALAFAAAGHVIHHTRILNERYLGRPAG